MNKIYKVIWSKTRNCYVAVAEFVKRNGKGGSVLNRRHIAAALAMVAICAAPAGALANSGGHWDSDDYIGDAPDYTVVIDSNVHGDVYGRREYDDTTATGASVTVESGTVGHEAPLAFVYGGYSWNGDATNNTVTVSGGTVGDYSTGAVAGGWSYNGDAANNTVTVSSGTVQVSVYGGFSGNGGAATNNMVTVSGGTVNDTVAGGWSYSGDATNNMVTVSGGTVNDTVAGGWSYSGDATNNMVTVSGGTVNNTVFGGWSWYGDATNNTVILSKEKEAPVLNGTLFGGYSESGGTVSNNTLQVEAVGLSAPEIQNFENYRFVLPSDVKKGDTMLTLKRQGANLTIDGTKVDMAVAKGSGLNIDFDDDSVTLLHKTGGQGAFSVTNLTGEVQTSKLDGESTGFDVMKYTLDKPDHEDKLNVTVSELHLYGDGGTNTPGQRQTGNTLEIKGGKANVAFGGRASSGAVTENHVIMNDGEIVDRGAIWAGDRDVSGMLIGGFAEDGNVEKNTVELSGGTVGSWVMGGYSVDGDITNNTVTVSGGTVRGFVYGGHSSSVGAATDNTVTIRGGTVSAKVYGGYSEDGDAKDNTVILSKVAGKAVPVIKETLFGGFSLTGAVSGNTLQVESVGLSAPEIQNFDNYRFMLPSDIKASNTMLQLTNQNDADVTIDPNRVSFTTDSSFGLNLDESITLLHKTGGSKTLNLNGYGEAYERLDGVPDGQPVKEFWLYTSDEKDKLNARYYAKNLYGEGGDNRKGQRVKGNTLTIGAGEIASNAYGGRVDSGDVTENEVKMSGGEIGIVYGGHSEKGSATGNTVTISGGTVEGPVYGGYSEADVFDTAIPTATDNTVNISGGTVKGSVYGSCLKGSAENNTVDISGGTVEGAVYGGYSYDNGMAVERNTIIIRGGTVEGDVCSGSSTNKQGFLTGNAKNNKVILSKMPGKEAPILGGNLWGSYSSRGSDNTLQVEAVGLSAPQIRNFDTYRFVLPSDIKAGDTMLTLTNQNFDDVPIDSSRVSFTTGSSFGLNLGDGITLLHKTGGSKTLNLNGYGSSYERLDGEADGLPVKEFKLNVSQENDKVDAEYAARYLYGEGGTNTKGQRESGNTLEIKGGKATAAFGGRATTNDVTENKVKMSGGELVQLSDSSDPDYGISGNLYGGYTDAGNVQGNTVEMSGGKVESSLYGGYTKSGMAGGSTEKEGNRVTVTGGEANDITGGSTDDGAAGYNTVSVSNAKVAHATGGATLEGDAVGNTVTLTNTELSCTVTGGDVYRGRAAENTVTIDGGSVGMDVFGGVSISGNVENNTVSIRGGKINGVLDGLKTGLTGGFGSERVVGNTVAITGGELFVESVYGGYHTSRSGSGLAEKNVVTLGGGSYDAGLNVIGGGSNNEANDNAVNLTGTTQGLDGAKLYGWKETEDGATVTGTGNELHVGGTKTYDKNGEAVITKGSWQGMDASGTHTNKVDTVANFDNIALHNVVWGDVPAISANEITNIGGLDVTGLEFFTHPNNSTVHEHAYKDYMVLVHADKNDLTGLKISYRDGVKVKTEPLTNEGIYYHDTTHHSTENGVTVDGIEKKRIYLADHNKSVDFCFHVDGDKITLGNVEFVKDDTARTLDGRFDVRNADIDADGFKMTDASMKGVEAGDFMTVVDAEDAIKNAKGETLKAFADQIYDVAFSDDVTANLNLSGTHTDTLSQNAEKTKLTYTVGEKNVSKAAMTGELAWQDGGVHYTNTVYNFNANAKTDLGGLTFGKVTTDPTGQSMTLINGKAAGTVENAPASFEVSLDKANVTLDATAAGTAAVANGDVTYTVTGVALDKVIVNRVTDTADAVPDGWTLAKDATGNVTTTVDTDSMTLPSGLTPGQVKTVIVGSGTDYFAGVQVTGSHVWEENGGTFAETPKTGVEISGVQTKSGVKVNEADKSRIVYEESQKNVGKAVVSGTIAWQDGGVHYENGSAANQKGVKAEYKFNQNSAVDVAKVTFAADADPLAGATKAMTLLKNVDGVVEAKVTGVPQFDVTLAQNNTTLEATADGTVRVTDAGGTTDVNYTVTGVTLDKVTVNRVTAAADTVPENWTLAKDATGSVTTTVDTENMILPDDMEVGTVRTVLTANSTADFKDVEVTGENAFKVHESFTEEENGVTVTGDKTGGVKKSADNKAIVYQAVKDHVSDVTLGDVDFAKEGTARAFTHVYDVVTANIDAENLKMTAESMKAVKAGDSMTVLDATQAIANAKGETLAAFGDKTYDVAFSDDVTADLNFSGTHTDTLSQNAEKTKLTYTVGEKNVSEATMTGELVWQDGATHYTNTSYNFKADAKTDLGGLTFAAVTTDPTGQSMTLIDGKAAGTVENAPASFGVSLDKTNTTLDATASGTAAVANGDVTYSVTGVTLDKVTVNQITDAADSVPDTWTMAKDASGKVTLTIDTENMVLPTGSANKEHAILTVDNDSFAGATVTGQYAYASHSPFTKANGGVSLAGEKEGGVKLSNDSKSVVYHVVQDHVKDVTLGSVTFAKDANLLTVGDEYEFTKVNTVNAQNFAMNYAAPQNVAVRDSMTLLQANNTLQANALLQKMAADVKTKTQPYRFMPAEGVNVAARITGSLGTTAKGDGFTYTVNSNQADSLTFGSVEWKDSGALFTRPAAVSFEGATVDTSKIHFKNVHGLDANKQMTLVSDFGSNVGKITGSKYYIGTTLEGEGRATLNGNDLMFTTQTGTNPDKPLHAQEQTHNTVMGQTAGISLLSSGSEQISQALNSLSLLDSFGNTTGTGGAMGGGMGSTTGTGTTVQTGGEGGSPAGQGGGTEGGSSGQTGGESGSSGQTGAGGSENSGQGQEGSGSETGSSGSETGTDKGQGEGQDKGQSEGSDDRNEKGSGKSDQQESNAETNGIIVAGVSGGHESVETGSHVTSNTWSGVLGIGGKRASKNGTLQYLAFAEHGRASFTLHSDTGRGDGTSKYVGGGLIGKWQNRRDVYVEASIRAGRMHDTANNMLYDEATGQSYGYDVHANYIGGHVGIGKVFTYNNGRTLDVYGKYFHMKRDGVSFEAGGHFDLDSVTSSVLRVGARYGVTDKKWNWYGGLAYEYEFDGKATGRADGAPIRAASMSGGSVRAEIGLRMEASKTSPWKADINLSGYAGKRRGISGNVAVAYTF